MQLRLVYSLFKPAVRCAARFGVPVRTVAELLRLAMYEALEARGLPLAEIAHYLGQTPRNARSLRAKMKTDFFAAEQHVGLVREIEDAIANRPSSLVELRAAFSHLSTEDVDAALESLTAQGRIERDAEDQLRLGRKYVVLSSEKFHNRIDALNHHMQVLHRAVVERLVVDNAQTAMIKTISFSAKPAELTAFMKRLEGYLRQEVAALEEQAEFDGDGVRFAIGVSVAPVDES